MTIFSGFMTSRTEARSRSRRISFIAIRFSDSRRRSANTTWPGSEMSSTERAIGPAAASSWRSTGKTLSIHQRATSGKDSISAPELAPSMRPASSSSREVTKPCVITVRDALGS